MADPIKKNNKNNVSTVKGVAGGYLFSAPVGTPMPKNFWEPLDQAFECLGYVTEDGLKEAVDGSGDDINDMNGDIVGETDATMTETLAFALMEISQPSLSTRFGHDNVEDSDATQIVVDHNWSKAKEERAIVADLVMKSGRRWRKAIESSTVSDRGEMQLNGGNVASHEATVKYLSDAEGSCCKDYIQKLDENGKPIAPPANDSEPPSNDPGEESELPALQEMTVEELREYASNEGIDLTGKTLKQDIIDAILAAI